VILGSKSLADYCESDSVADIKSSFYDDIAKKYGLPREILGRRLHNRNEEYLRSLVVFGEHEYIIDVIRSEIGGSF